MPIIILPEADCNSSRCGICNQYLSVGPIFMNSNYKPVCGRCQLSDGSKFTATFYETIGKKISFPCRNDRYGCDIRLPWDSVPSHEKICNFQPMKCPALKCNDEIGKEQVQKHFRKFHPELIMNTNEFKLLRTSNDNNTNRLYICNNKEYLVQIANNQETNFFNILSFEEMKEKRFYDIVINEGKKNSTTHRKKVEIRTYEERNHNYSKMTEIDYNTISKLLGENIFCQFTISRKESCSIDPLNTRLLSNLECPVCFDYMKPPIFMCDRAHCICESCKSKITECPSCREPLKQSRNFALEKITNDVLYPCKNRTEGCCFNGKIDELGPHERSCSASDFFSKNMTCPIQISTKCCWVGSINNIVEHMRNRHESNYLILGNSYKLKWCRVTELVYFTMYNGDIFRITLNFGNTVGFRTRIWPIGKRKCDYKFIMKITKNENDFLALSKGCGGNISHINRSVVKHYIQNNEVTVRINIMEQL